MTTRPLNIMRSLGFSALVAGLCLWATVGRSNTIISTTSSQSFTAPIVSMNTLLVDTATQFAIQTFEVDGVNYGLYTTDSGINYFAFSGTASPQVMTQNASPNVTFNTAIPASLSFTDPGFGTFSAASLDRDTNTAGTRYLTYSGTYSGGSSGGVTYPNPAPATFIVQLNQSGASVSMSATLTIVTEPQPVPEPSTMVLGMLGLAGFATATWRRRTRRLPAGLDAQIGAVQEDAAVVVDA